MQPVIRNDRRGRALSQAAKEHERKRKLESEGFETNLDQPDRTTPNQPTKTPHADSTGTDGARADKLHLQSEVRDLCGWRKVVTDIAREPDEKTITVIKFDCKFGADRPGDPKRQVVIMVATDSANKS